MILIDKTTVPHCFVEEKKFDWGEPYTHTVPIFNVCVDPELSDIEFTIEILGKNNFKNGLSKLYNILLNHEEKQRINHCKDSIVERDLLLKKINDYMSRNSNDKAPWQGEYEQEHEIMYLEMIETDIKRPLCYERKIIY